MDMGYFRCSAYWVDFNGFKFSLKKKMSTRFNDSIKSILDTSVPISFHVSIFSVLSHFRFLIFSSEI